MLLPAQLKYVLSVMFTIMASTLKMRQDMFIHISCFLKHNHYSYTFFKRARNLSCWAYLDNHNYYDHIGEK